MRQYVLFFHNGCQVLVCNLIIFLGLLIHFNNAAMSMKQLEKTMETLRIHAFLNFRAYVKKC
uniref:CSON014071 protein n=1 Tax=Culicoides sonorensis TaxID=179676 RepID=A0A336MLV8_CULSO